MAIEDARYRVVGNSESIGGLRHAQPDWYRLAGCDRASIMSGLALQGSSHMIRQLFGRIERGAGMKCAVAALCLLAGLALAAEPVTLSLPDLSGNPQTLKQYRGRVVVLNFWATWCVPCRAEMPLLVDIQNRYAARGVVVVGASADDETTQTQIIPFVEKLRITFPIWTGATTPQMDQLGLGTALPATAIINQHGEIVFRIIGILERKDLTRRLDYLLAGKGKAPESLIDTLSTTTHEGHDHGKEEEHTHGGVGVEGASMVPS